MGGVVSGSAKIDARRQIDPAWSAAEMRERARARARARAAALTLAVTVGVCTLFNSLWIARQSPRPRDLKRKTQGGLNLL